MSVAFVGNNTAAKVDSTRTSRSIITNSLYVVVGVGANRRRVSKHRDAGMDINVMVQIAE